MVTIAKGDLNWADQEEIFGEVNEDGGEPIGSTSTLYSELQKLKDKKLIQKKKEPSGTKHGYVVTTLDIPDTIALPHPSKIQDPLIQGKRIKIENPITLDIQEV